jgi:hypothetical protein
MLHDPTDESKKITRLKEMIAKKKAKTDVFQKVID